MISRILSNRPFSPEAACRTTKPNMCGPSARPFSRRYACVPSFTPADEKLAADLFRRGVPPEHLRRAIWLGCARKYMAMLNGGPRAPIASLAYFVSLLEEITEATASDTYWEHLQQKVEALETRDFGPTCQTQLAGSEDHHHRRTNHNMPN
jgi:hypothetical protein